MRSEERVLIEWLIEHGYPEAKDYAEQVGKLRVVSSCSCGCPTIDLAVGNADATTGSSQILADFLGTTAEGTEVGVILHAREGRISELEIYPLAENPSSLPRIDTLREF